MDIRNTILLIDEDEVMHYLIQVILDKFNATGKIKASFTGNDALEYLETNASENNFPKLIVVNFNEGITNGISLIKRITSIKFYSSSKTEIFVLSSDLKEDSAEELKALGVQKILPRPQLPEGFGRLRS